MNKRKKILLRKAKPEKVEDKKERAHGVRLFKN